MSSTLAIPSFADINLLERSTLSQGSTAGDDTIKLESTQGYLANQTIFVGTPAREGCESAVIQAVTDQTTLTLTSGLKLAHTRFESVVSVVGGSIRIYRAANVDGTVPDDGLFSLIQTRTIDPDQQTTYYTDPDGSSDYWYKLTYYDQTANAETALSDAVAVRGDDFGHYASLTEIRRDAGFENAYNLSDVTVDQHRRTAEAEINASLATAYTVPFSPVPEIIHTLTIQLASGFLMNDAYKGRSAKAKDQIKDARAAIKAFASRDATIVDENGASTATGTIVSSYPGDSESRAFSMDMRL